MSFMEKLKCGRTCLYSQLGCSKDEEDEKAG